MFQHQSSQDSNLSTGSGHSNDAAVGAVLQQQADQQARLLDPSPEKLPVPVTQARTPTERKRKRKNTTSAAVAAANSAGGDQDAKSAKKINEYFKHTPSSPVPPVYGGGNGGGGSVSGASGGGASGLYGGQTVTTPGSPYSGNNPDYSVAVATLRNTCSFSSISMQTDMTAADVSRLETRAAAEMETKESRIDELLRMNSELTRQLGTKQKEGDEKSTTIDKCLQVI